jgi:hypothetical protein
MVLLRESLGQATREKNASRMCRTSDLAGTLHTRDTFCYRPRKGSNRGAIISSQIEANSKIAHQPYWQVFALTREYATGR